MLVESLKFPMNWISRTTLQECKFHSTYINSKREAGILVTDIKGMGIYNSEDGLIPFSLELFLDRFKPKLES